MPICCSHYDQVQFTGEGLLSLTYWTIVGAYLVPGEKNETKTMLDAAVFYIASRRGRCYFVLRALAKMSMTLPRHHGWWMKQLHENSEEGFKARQPRLI